MSGNILISKGNIEEWEDACFTHNQAIGIADGVGGWSNYGMSSADFSNELMKRCEKLCIKVLQIRKFTSNLIKSSEFKLKLSDYKWPISEQVKCGRFHAHSFWYTEEGENEFPLKNLLEESEVYQDDNDNLSFELGKQNQSVPLDPLLIIEEAYKYIKSFGSSTICVCTLEENKLKVANLGDSGMILLRYNQEEQESKVISCTQDQQHEFNAPYQLAKIPKDIQEKINAKRNNIDLSEEKSQPTLFWEDPPESADTYEINVRAKDIAILGTDGLFDNLFLDDILDIVDMYMRSLLKSKEKKIKSSSKNICFDKLSNDMSFTEKEAQVLAWKLGKAAKTKSRSMRTISPFEQKYNKFMEDKKEEEVDHIWQGGKSDDIGVVVSFII